MSLIRQELSLETKHEQKRAPKEEKTILLSHDPADILSTITPSDFEEAKQYLISHGYWPIAENEKFQEILIKAAAKGDLVVIALLCKHGLNPNGSGDVNKRPLLIAIQHGKIKAALLLLQFTTQVRSVDLETVLNLVHLSDFQLRPILVAEMRKRNDNLFASEFLEAAYDGHIETFKYLKPSTDPKDSYGSTILHYANMGGHLQVIKELEKIYVRQRRSGAHNKENMPPFNFAVAYEHFDVVNHVATMEKNDLSHVVGAMVHCKSLRMARFLIKNKARVDIKYPGGITIIHDIWHGFPALDYPKIYEYCANQLKDTPSYNEFINNRDDDRRTLFFSVITSASTKPEQRKIAAEMKEVLLRLKVDINIPDAKGFTPLHGACNQINVEAVEFLLEKGAVVNTRSQNGFSPISSVYGWIWDEKAKLDRPQARSHALVQIKELLIKAGANTNFELELKAEIFRPLQDAVKNNDFAEVLLLLKYKPDLINTKNSLGKTALFYARTPEMARLLLNCGADIAARDNLGNAVLHYGQPDHMIDFFLENKADANVTNQAGLTPLRSFIRLEVTPPETLLRHSRIGIETFIDMMNHLMDYPYLSKQHWNVIATILIKITPGLQFIADDKNANIQTFMKDYVDKLNLELPENPKHVPSCLFVRAIGLEVKGDRAGSLKYLHRISDEIKTPMSQIHTYCKARVEALIADAKESKHSPAVVDCDSLTQFFACAMKNIVLMSAVEQATCLLEWSELISNLLSRDVLTPMETQQLYFLKKAHAEEKPVSISQQIQNLQEELGRLFFNEQFRRNEIERQLSILKELDKLGVENEITLYTFLTNIQKADLKMKLGVIKPMQYGIAKRIPACANLSARQHVEYATLLLEYEEPAHVKNPLSMLERFKMALDHVNKAVNKSDRALKKEALELKGVLERALQSEMNYEARKTESRFCLRR